MTLDRREFTTLVATTTAAVVTAGLEASAQPRHPAPPPLNAAPGEKAIVPLPFAPGALPGLSARLLTTHHDTNYGGAVRKLNEIRTQLASADPAQSGGYWSLYGTLRAAELNARNSAMLHELYFANLAPPPSADASVAMPAALGTMLAQRFGSVERFQAQCRGAAKAANGWVVLATDPLSRTLEVVQTESHGLGAWGATPLLVLDVYEHAYAIDYGADKNAYFDAFWRNVAWNEVQARAQLALGRL